MPDTDWVEVARFEEAGSGVWADLCLSGLKARGIPAMRLPTGSLANRFDGIEPVVVLVPPAMAKAARAVLAETPWMEAACFEGLNAEDRAERLMASLEALGIEFIRFPYEPEPDPLRTDKVRILVPRENLDEAQGIAKRIH